MGLDVSHEASQVTPIQAIQMIDTNDRLPLRCHHGTTLCGWCHYHRLQAVLRKQRGRK